MRNVVNHTVLVCFAAALTSACSYEDRIVATPPSPNGETEAIIYVRGGGGATTGYAWDVKLPPANYNFLTRQRHVYRAMRVGCLWVEWASNDKLVIHAATYTANYGDTISIRRHKENVRLGGRAIAIENILHPAGFKDEKCYPHPFYADDEA